MKKQIVAEKILNDFTESPREDVDIDLVWNVTDSTYEEITTTETIKKITPYHELLSTSCGETEFFDACPIFEICKSNLSALYDDYAIKLQQIELYQANHRDAIITMCYVGIFFGSLGGALLMFLICCLKDRKVSRMLEKTNEKQKLRKAIRERSQFARKTVKYYYTQI